MSKVSSQFKRCHFSNEFSEIKTKIHPEYIFSCLKGINDGCNPFIIYRTINGGIEEIHHSDSFDDSSLNKLVELILSESVITDKLLVAGAHTVVDLSNRLDIGEEPIVSLEFSLKLIEALRSKANINADFMIPLNDFFMEHDPTTTSGSADNRYRQEAVVDYILPTKAEDLVIKHLKETGVEIKPFYCSEKGMADRFNRYIKNKKEKTQNYLHALIMVRTGT